MKNRNRQNTRQTFGRSIFCTALAMAVLGMTGCEDPQLLDQETYYQDKKIKLPNGEKYELDIAMITPFAGHINPERKELYLYIADHKVYKNAIDVSTADCSTGACAEIDDSNIRLEDNRLKLKVSDNHELTCEVYNERNTIPEELVKNFEEISSAEASDIQYAHCSYYLGGAVGLYQTWEALKRKDTNGNDITQIRVSSGDSFGTSADISARFDDIPTPIALNAIGLHVDTFGNHSFDKDLNYLRDVISWADYKYVATNLVNVPQNLDDVSPRILFDIPSNKDKETDMRVAVVSALDMQANESVYPGRFGSLDIGNYCTLIQSIEDAYNDGARAFFILGHLLMNKDSLKAFFNALFYFADHQFHSFGIDDGTSTSECSSVIEVPAERLQHDLEIYYNNNKDYILNKLPQDEKINSASEFKFFSIKALNFKDALEDRIDFTDNIPCKDDEDDKSTCISLNQFRIDAYKDIIENIHKEIYNGIIAVLGEGADPLFTLIYPDYQSNSENNKCLIPQSPENSAVAYNVNGCTNAEYTFTADDSNSNSNEKETITYSFDQHIRNSNILPYYPDWERGKYVLDNNKLTFSSPDSSLFPSNIYAFLGENSHELELNSILDKIGTNDIHPIPFIQLPSNGKNTIQLNVSIEQLKEPQDEDNEETKLDDSNLKFIAKLQNLKYVPAIDTISSEKSHDGQDIDTCQQNINQLWEIYSPNNNGELSFTRCQDINASPSDKLYTYNCVCENDISSYAPDDLCGASPVNPCDKYFKTRTDSPNFPITSLSELKSQSDAHNKSNEPSDYDNLMMCFDFVRKHILSKHKLDIQTQKVNSLTDNEVLHVLNMLNCMYLASSEIACQSEKNSGLDSFEEPLLFSFPETLWKNLKLDEINDKLSPDNDGESYLMIRQQSTFVTNLTVDSILHYMNHHSDTNYDFAMINAGAVRYADELNHITFSKLNELVPHVNQVVPVTLNIKDFVELVSAALARQITSGGKAGGYPVFSGVRIASSKSDIHAVWLVDPNGAIIEPIYIKKENEKINCAPNATCTIEKDTLTLSAPPDTLFCVGENGTYDDCSNKEFQMAKLKNDNDDGNEWVSSNKTSYTMLTLDYLTTGGDGYDFSNTTVQGKVLDYKAQGYVYEYLSNKELKQNISEIYGESSPKCSDVQNHALSTTTADKRHQDQFLCSLMTNRHFAITTNDIFTNNGYYIANEDTISQNCKDILYYSTNSD